MAAATTKVVLVYLVLLLAPVTATAGGKPPGTVHDKTPARPTVEPPVTSLEIGDHGTFLDAEFGFETTEGDSCYIRLDAQGQLTTTNRVWSGFDCPYAHGTTSAQLTPKQLRAFLAVVTQHAASSRFRPRGSPPPDDPPDDYEDNRVVRTTEGTLIFGNPQNAWEIDSHLIDLHRSLSPTPKP